MSHPPSPITCPRKLCTVCARYRAIGTGCRQKPGRPFVCASCVEKRT